MHHKLALVLAIALCGCSTPEGDPPDGGPGTPGDRLAGLSLLPRLAGLWSGPATGTPLGAFPVMNMDLRAATDRVLFSRADLDAKNSLRFAFAIESRADTLVLVFRNGGAFQGLLRDSRAPLISAGPADLRFCAPGPGPQDCTYIDARFTLSGAADERLTLDVKVRGAGHLLWQAARQEPRALPRPFPADTAPVSQGDDPFPPLPSLRTTVRWDRPLAQDATVWLVLSQSECSFNACNISRSISAPAAAGSQEVVLQQEQLHPGDYKALAVLDRNNNFPATLRPDSGDGLSLPNQPITISPSGEAALAARVFYDLP